LGGIGWFLVALRFDDCEVIGVEVKLDAKALALHLASGLKRYAGAAAWVEDAIAGEGANFDQELD
jgi:hypothetical protein